MLPRTAPAAVRAAVDRWMTAWGEKDSPITFSAGIAQHQAGRLVGATVLEADRALYRAKQEGRNRVYAELS